MLKKYTLITITLVAALISGCTTPTQTTGTKLAELNSPLKNILVIANDNTFDGALNQGGNPIMHRQSKLIFSKISKQLPIVFALNGLNAEFVFTNGKENSPVIVKDGVTHTLTIIPFSGDYTTQGVANINVRNTLTEISAKKTLWNGTARVNLRGSMNIDEASGNEFSKALLMQLKKDGVVSFTTAEPVMPK
jgi:hypothetical protein